MGTQVSKGGMGTKLDLNKLKTHKGQLISKDLFMSSFGPKNQLHT